ncbi:capsular polysaccharide transport system permease protein [Neorhizobium sp. 2083]|uniref:hypothetical protein n=1 Tax=Neorhizobium sp. 2083 TaxID=2817762 RepID=UPI0028671EE8|nr:hypothetical protein [Neorhizobium sp. 2083]MDR6818100.1 capsular polysaccharide transport system permease protein [Neorhizobium sp. 2083]
MIPKFNHSGQVIEQYDQAAPSDKELDLREADEFRRPKHFYSKKNSFIFFVAIPSFLAAIFYGLVVSEQYTSEVRMIVRTIGVSERFDTSEQREGRSIIGGDSLTQDSYIVANYLTSPEIVRRLDEEIGLHKRFSRIEIDLLSRLPSEAGFEKLQKYWKRQVGTYVDGPSGIIVFTVRAFSPSDAVEISDAALGAADRMIARISDKAQRDLVARAESEVKNSLKEYQTALDELKSYQNKTGILDPTSSAKLTTEVIAKLTEERLKLVVQLKGLEAANADNSAKARQLNRSITALDEQIKSRQDSLAGESSTRSQLSQALTEFSRLETNRIVSQALYEAAVRNLDTARSTALKRTTFMSVFSRTNLPEKSEYPARFSSWLIFSLGLFTLWITGMLIWMSVEDHRT